MIKDQLHQEILLWNGKCEPFDVIPSPPVYFANTRCSRHDGVEWWNHTEYDSSHEFIYKNIVLFVNYFTINKT